jgi:6-phosphogluconolactonase
MTEWTRRTFLSASAATIALSRLSATAMVKGAAPPAGKWIYVGSTAMGEGEGIHVGDWNAASGTIGNLRLAYACIQPSFQVTAHTSDGSFLFSGHQPQPDKAALSSFSVLANGDLKLINTVDLEDQPESFIQIVLDKTHRALVSASYRTSKVRSFKVGRDGHLSDAVSEFTLTGSGPNQRRQTTAHAHGAVISPDNKFALINDLGSDKIMVYKLDPESAKLTPNGTPFFQAKPGSGPRHTAFHPSGRWAYSINELDSSITTMSWAAKTGVLTTIDNTPTTEPGVDIPKNRAGEVIFDSTGKFLYACNRGAAEELLVYKVGADGKLTLASRAPLAGKEARHYANSPDNGYIVVAEQATNFASVFKRDRSSGGLTPTGNRYAVNKASSISFV